jgi:hypothetical protein
VRYEAARLCGALLLIAAACSSSRSLSHPSTSDAPVASTTIDRAGSLGVPRTYTQACANEPSVCEPGASGALPAALLRPLRLPTVAHDSRCPTSTGTTVNNAYFGGVALGRGPVRPIPAARGDLVHGVVQLSTATGVPGWLGFKTLWFSTPSYQGPWMVRAKRLDGPGPIAFGETPTLEPLVVPPGETLNASAGFRTAPGGTWVKSPGCYGWQVDGLTFSNTIVVNAVLATRAPN